MNNNKHLLAIVLALIISCTLAACQTDNKPQTNQNSISHKANSKTELQTPKAQEKAQKTSTTSINKDFILSSPKQNEKVTSPLTVKGQATGSWFAEGTLNISIYTKEGKKLAQHFGRADGEWMTTDLVDFTGTLNFDIPEALSGQSGKLVIANANPSGEAKYAKRHAIAVIFGEATKNK